MTDAETPLLPTSTPPPAEEETRFEKFCTWVKESAQKLKREIITLYIASNDERVPILAKIICAFVLAMALSPIDIIPDFIPILGLLDDIILIPIGLWLAMRMIPDEVWVDARQQASLRNERLPPNYYAATLIVLLWIVFAVWIVHAFLVWRAGK